jgi:hypothetical protein
MRDPLDHTEARARQGSMRELCTRRSGHENALEIHPSARESKIIGAFANRGHDYRGVGGLPFASHPAWRDGVRPFGRAVGLASVACQPSSRAIATSSSSFAAKTSRRLPGAKNLAAAWRS